MCFAFPVVQVGNILDVEVVLTYAPSSDPKGTKVDAIVKYSWPKDLDGPTMDQALDTAAYFLLDSHISSLKSKLDGSLMEQMGSAMDQLHGSIFGSSPAAEAST